MDAIVVVSFGAQALVVSIGAAVDFAQYACDTVFSAVWQSLNSSVEVLRDGSAGEKRGGDHKDLHCGSGSGYCDVREKIQTNPIKSG